VFAAIFSIFSREAKEPKRFVWYSRTFEAKQAAAPADSVKKAGQK
jgi:hypothetical protein